MGNRRKIAGDPGVVSTGEKIKMQSVQKLREMLENKGILSNLQKNLHCVEIKYTVEIFTFYCLNKFIS